MPASEPSGWMILLAEHHSERSGSAVRGAIYGGAMVLVLLSYVASSRPDPAVPYLLAILAAGVLTAVLMAVHSRRRKVSTLWGYVLAGFDATLVSGCLLSVLHTRGPHASLTTPAQLAYALAILGAASRLHAPTIVFAAVMSALQYIAITAYAYHRLPTGPLEAQMLNLLNMLMRPAVLVGAGLVAARVVRRVHRILSVAQEADRLRLRLINQLSDGLIVCTQEQRIIEVNAAACSMLQLPRRRLLELDVYTALPPELAWTLRERWPELMREWALEVRGVQGLCVDEQRQVLDLDAHVLGHCDGQLVQLVLRDVTAQTHLREQAEQVERMRVLRSLGRHLTHEFNNIFASIETAAYSLAQALPPGASQQTEVGIIRAGVSRATGLMTEMIELADQTEPSLAPADVKELLDKALAQLPPPAAVTVKLDVPECMCCVLADERQLTRAFGNLISFAYGSMLDGGTLRVEMREQAPASDATGATSRRHVVVQFCDTGIGIPAEEAARAFDLTFRIDEQDWTGLSLASVRAIVERHGGTIALHSVLGKGNCFTITLPATEPLASTTSESSLDAGTRKRRVLVVDDDISNRTALARLLGLRGFEVLLAQDGHSAIELCERERGAIDLVLLDMMMPGISGTDVLMSLQARFPEISVLVVTGTADRTLSDQALTLGAKDVAPKPYDAESLLARINRIMDQRAVS